MKVYNQRMLYVNSISRLGRSSLLYTPKDIWRGEMRAQGRLQSRLGSSLGGRFLAGSLACAACGAYYMPCLSE